MLTPEQFVALAMLVCTAGATATLVLSRRATLAGWIAFGTVAAAGVLAWLGAGRVLLTGAGHAETFFTVASMGFSLRLHVDGLSAVFLILIATVSIPAALYSIDYMRHHLEHGVGRYYPNLLLFIAAMYGLVSTTDVMYFFFIFWQMMTLTGYALIRYEPRKPENVRAANRYLWMMQLACVVTMIGAGLLARGAVQLPSGELLLRYDIDAVSHHLPLILETQPGLAAFAFALFLVGFGIKVGMWPFGRIWLPDAHPAAPSPVSALLSGVMIKTGVYGLLRCFLWLVPAEAIGDFPAARWGFVIAILGTITLLTGTVDALRQEQSKRLLAYSSIGQAGYILLALGICLALLPGQEPGAQALAALALAGALFHTVNHGVFKSLLFLNAGSILHATGTQDLNKLGGLIRFMPLTAFTAFIGAAAIAGVPLTSGFASKWTIYSAAIPGAGSAWFLPLCIAIAILTSALTLALFVKFYGALFLSRTSALVLARSAHSPSLEVGRTMRLAQSFLALVCVAGGLLPFLTLHLISQALLASGYGLAAIIADSIPLMPTVVFGLGAITDASVYAPLAVGIVLALIFLTVRFVARLGGATRRATTPWLCGYAVETEVNRYRAGHLYGEIKRFLPARATSPVPVTEPDSVAEPTPKPIAPWSLEKS
jgi:hydrogenase-4 component B